MPQWIFILPTGSAAVKGSRSIIRKSLMQLETAGLVVRNKNNGRVVTPKGQALLDNAAKEVIDSN